jgi:enterochelin esterase-like enzyme
VIVLEPQGTFFFLMLLVAFGGLVTWLVMTSMVVFRIVAAALAFIPAMVFGIAVVNKYYDYYQTWGSLVSDLSGQSASVPQLSAAGLGKGTSRSLISTLGQSNDAALDAKYGLLFRTTITGQRSRISRQAYVYLPPQYFSKAYATYKFPAIELLHGSPGDPSAWVNVMNVIPVFLQALDAHKADPAVLVMPNTDGGPRYALQCLNDPHGIQDMTYVGKDVPAWVAANLRVQPPGPAWGIAGYSEGGYCAANLGLRYAASFGAVGSLSGYFSPIPSQIPVDGTPRDVNVYAHSAHLEMINSPDEYILHLPVSKIIPQFFLAAGATDTGDVTAARTFQQELELRDADVPLDIVQGGGHQALVWRAALSPMLEWMTPQLAEAVHVVEYHRKQVLAEARREKAKAAAAAKKAAAKKAAAKKAAAQARATAAHCHRTSQSSRAGCQNYGHE